MIRATIYTTVFFALAVLVTHSCRRSADAAARARAADDALRSIRADSDELIRARDAFRPAAAVTTDARPLLSLVRDASDTAGIDPDALKEFSADPPPPRSEPVSASPLPILTAHQTLAPISLHQLGLFLAAWHAMNTPWLVTAIQLDRAPEPKRVPTQPPDQERFSVRLTLVAPLTSTESAP